MLQPPVMAVSLMEVVKVCRLVGRTSAAHLIAHFRKKAFLYFLCYYLFIIKYNVNNYAKR